jgi:hypothetical protein
MKIKLITFAYLLFVILFQTGKLNLLRLFDIN